jgi:transcriptional regulator with XRE-family HTH domain
MSTQARDQADTAPSVLLLKMPLHELRGARGMSQKVLAGKLRVEQPSVAKLERCTDMYLLTLRGHIESIGGELDQIARFPDGAVKIRHFAELDV